MARPLARLALLALVACGGPQGQRLTPAEFAALEAQMERDARAPAPPPGRSPAALQIDARRAALDARHAELRARVDALALEHDLATRREALDLRFAEQRLLRARRERELHDAVVAPLRVRAAELALDEAAAAQRAAEQELSALETLWTESGEAASDTAAAMLARARDELARARAAHEVALLRRRDLLERELPARIEALEEELALAEWQVDAARAAGQIGELERARASAALEAERQALQGERAALEEQGAELARGGGLRSGA